MCFSPTSTNKVKWSGSKLITIIPSYLGMYLSRFQDAGILETLGSLMTTLSQTRKTRGYLTPTQEHKCAQQIARKKTIFYYLKDITCISSLVIGKGCHRIKLNCRTSIKSYRQALHHQGLTGDQSDSLSLFRKHKYIPCKYCSR